MNETEIEEMVKLGRSIVQSPHWRWHVGQPGMCLDGTRWTLVVAHDVFDQRVWTDGETFNPPHDPAPTFGNAAAAGILLTLVRGALSDEAGVVREIGWHVYESIGPYSVTTPRASGEGPDGLGFDSDALALLDALKRTPEF